MTIEKLADVVADPEKFRSLIRDGVALVDEEVSKRKGLSGMAIKTGYATVKTFAPGFTEKALMGLLPEFVEALEPFYAHFKQFGGAPNFAGYLTHRPSEVADALLSVTDRRSMKENAKQLKSIYDKLRPMAKGAVEDALPGLANMLSRYV